MPYVGRELTRGSYIKLDDIQSQFNGSKTTFNLTSGGSAFYAGSATSVLVSIGGTVQEPVTEYGIDHNQIVFAVAPTSSQNFFCVALGVALGVGVPARGSTGGNQLAKPLNYDDGLLYLDSANDRVGIKTTSVGKVLDVYGGDARFNDGLVSNSLNVTGIVTAGELDINGNGDISGNLVVGGNFTAQGDFTTLNTTLRNVELLRVSATSNTTAGIITQTGSGDILNLFDATTEVLTVTDGGKVGINETNPRHHLTVNSGTTNVAIAVSSTDAGSFISYQDNTTGDTGSNSEVYAGATGGSFVIHTDAQTTPRVTVTNGGKVGIGTDDPQRQLHVLGTTRPVEIGSTNATNIVKLYNSATGRATYNGVDIMASSTDGAKINAYGGYISLGTTATNGVDAVERVRISSGGKVGFGTDMGGAPASSYAVGAYRATGTSYYYVEAGADDASAGLRAKAGAADWTLYTTEGIGKLNLYDNTTSKDRFTIDTSGNVGINSTAPGGTLDVVGTNDATINLKSWNHNTNHESVAKLTFGYAHSGSPEAEGYIKVAENGSNSFDGRMQFGVPYNNSSSGSATRLAMTIKHSGHVGIGTTLPSGTLELARTNSTDMLMFREDGSNAVFAKIGYNSASGTAILDTRSEGHMRFLTGGANERLRIKSDGELVVNHTQSSTPLNNTFLSIYDANSDSSAIDASGVSKNYAMISLHNYGTGIVGDTTGIGFGAASGFSYTKGSIAFARSGDYGRGDLVFLTNNDQSTAMVNDTDERMRITKGGDISMSGDGTVHGISKLTIKPANRTTAFDASDGDSWHDVVIKHEGDATNNAVGLAFEVSADAYHKNAGTGIAAVKQGTDSDYGSDLVFITRGQSVAASEKVRITSDGKVLVGDGGTITPVKQFDVRGTGFQSILVGSTNNQGAQLVIDGIGGGDASGGNYSALAVGTGGNLEIKNYDADKGIILGTGSAIGANDTVIITDTQRVGINTTSPDYTLEVIGSFAATTKSFVIDHPTKENHSLRYACLEGPENSVYVRGRSSDPVIELPDYWVGLVHDDSITVNVTPIGNKNVWVESINNNSVTIGSDDSTEYFYTVFAERKDVEKLEVEVEK